jgi:hypothetical protein
MNAIAYKIGYAEIGLLQRIGHRLPKSLLHWWILRTPTEIETLRQYRAGQIDVDRFDLLVDREIVLIRAYNRTGRR